MAGTRCTPRDDRIAKMAARAVAIVLLVAIHVALFFALNPRFEFAVVPPAKEIVLVLPPRMTKPVTGRMLAPNFATPRIPAILPPVLPPSIVPKIQMPPQ